jgi:ABC-type spermidine/putrescine transport system permease subunit I
MSLWSRVDPTPLLLLLPLLIIFAVFFFQPVVRLLVTSIFAYSRTTIVDTSRVTLEHYERFLLDPFYLDILLRSLRISLTTTLICLALGYPAALHIARTRGRAQALMLLVFLSPLLVSLVVRTYAWTLLLSGNGILNSTLLRLGLIGEPLKIMWTETAVVIGLTHIYLAYMILPIFTSLVNQDPNLLRAAENLGAPPWRAFLLVTLPLSLPGVMAGCMLVFILTMAAFVTPVLLGGVWVKVIAATAYEQTVSFLNWPFGAAISVILLAITLGVVALYQRLMRLGNLGATTG